MKTLKVALVAIAFAFPVQLLAQDRSGASGGLEEITVTAQRKPETLQSAAIPINVATGERLELLGIGNAEKLNKISPALAVSSGGGANTAFFVRGVGNFTNNGYTNPAIAFNLDGVYVGRPSSTISSFLDLNRVEVLKGPQGTLYGRNSTGGAINVIPNKPTLGENSGSIRLGVGNYEATNVTGIGNFALGDSTAIRAAAIVSQHDGYFSDGTSELEDVALRFQLYGEPSDAFNYRVSADYSTQKGTGAGVQVNGRFRFTPFSPDLPVPNWTWIPLPADAGGDYTGLHTPETLQYIGDNVASAPGFMPYVGFAYPSRDDSYSGIMAELNFALGETDLVIIPAYRVSKLNNRFNGPPFKAALNQDEAKQASLEARLSGDSERFDWLLGAHYYDENVEGVNSFNQFSNANQNDWDSSVEAIALFARGTFSISDNFRLVAGIRYTDESRSMDAMNDATVALCLEETVGRPPFCPQIESIPVGLTQLESLSQLDPALFPTGSPINPDGTITPGARPYGPINYFAPAQFGPGALMIITPSSYSSTDGDTEPTYRLAFEYDLADDNMLYASYESGFRAGGFNLSQGNETYKPEYIDAYTIGSKNRFLDNTFELNVELFYWDYQDQQLAALGLDENGNNSFFTRNVGAATIKGAEIDFQWAASDNTLLRGAVQFLDSTYDSFTFKQVDLSDVGDPPNFLTPVNGCDNTQVLFQGDNVIPWTPQDEAVPGNERGFIVDCSGKDALKSPEWTATFGIQHTFNLGSYALIGNLDGRYRGERELGFNYLPEGRAPSVVTADASLTLLSDNGNWTLNAYVLNLTDETIATTYQLGSGSVSGSALEPPMTYGIRFGYDF